MVGETPKITLLLATFFGFVLAIILALAISFNDIVLATLVGSIFILIFTVVASGENAISSRAILCFVVSGYFFAGKGFAYLGSYPFYIGEICLAATGAVLAFRIAFKRAKIMPSGRMGQTLLFLIFSGLIQLFFSLPTYGLLAARDFMMIGYAGYFFVAYDAFADPKKRKKIYLIWCFMGLFGILTTIQFIFNFGWPEVIPFNLKNRPIFQPHDDTRVPICATAFIILIMSISKSYFLNMVKYVSAMILIVYLTVYGKSAYLFASICAAFPFLLTKLRKRLFVFLCLMIVLAVPIALSLIVIGQDTEERINYLIKEIESFKPENFFTKAGQASGATSEWRVFWWKKIALDTFHENLLFGKGLGADITFEFQKQYFGHVVVEDDGSLPRYPHNIIFTVIGRLGFFGLVVWLFFFFRVIKDGIDVFVATKTYQVHLFQLALWAFVFAGLGNSLVQSTFEAPYAAIPFWIILACAYRERETILANQIKQLAK